jgi:antirestriction protein ArdC
VEAFVKATDAEIKTGGNQPMYVPSLDYVVMPPAEAFRTVEHFYATELHELGHYAEPSVMPRRSGVARKAWPDRRFHAA